MYMYLHVYVCVCVRVCMYIHGNIYACMCTPMYICRYVHWAQSTSLVCILCVRVCVCACVGERSSRTDGCVNFESYVDVLSHCTSQV